MSPRSREQNEEIRNQRIREILQAAIHVYVEKGYAAAEIGEVAERAGLARGLVYYYFKDKKTLFRDLYQHMMERSRSFTQAHFEQEGSALELFTGYAGSLCKSVLDTPEIPRFFMRISFDVHQLYAADEFSPLEWVKRFLEPMVKAIEKGQKQGTIRAGASDLMASQFWGAVSHGLNYLDQLQQELISKGISTKELAERLQPIVEQTVESAVNVLQPE